MKKESPKRKLGRREQLLDLLHAGEDAAYIHSRAVVGGISLEQETFVLLDDVASVSTARVRCHTVRVDFFRLDPVEFEQKRLFRATETLIVVEHRDLADRTLRLLIDTDNARCIEVECEKLVLHHNVVDRASKRNFALILAFCEAIDAELAKIFVLDWTSSRLLCKRSAGNRKREENRQEQFREHNGLLFWSGKLPTEFFFNYTPKFEFCQWSSVYNCSLSLKSLV